jgi:hypothetical protein
MPPYYFYLGLSNQTLNFCGYKKRDKIVLGMTEFIFEEKNYELMHHIIHSPKITFPYKK